MKNLEKKRKIVQEKKKTKQKQNKTNERKREKRKKKVSLPTHPIFSNDFSHVVYLILHQNSLSTKHLRY